MRTFKLKQLIPVDNQGGKQFMQKSLFRKGLVLGIIVLFVGASVVPSITANIIDDENINNEKQLINEDGF